VEGAFVEARVFAEKDVALNQAQVWTIASALDEKIRALSVDQPKR